MTTEYCEPDGFDPEDYVDSWLGDLNDGYWTDDEIDRGEADAEQETIQYADGFTFVNVYELDRAYGGPEEGGWYFDAGQLILSRQVPVTAAESVRTALQERYPSTGKRYSVIYAGGDYSVCLEDHPGADYPEHTPHYE
jgi:hypothetical protein